jgi:hypothetical protein
MKPKVPFPLGSKTSKHAGATRGRLIDTEFQRSVATGIMAGSNAVKIHAALEAAGVLVTGVQQRVTTPEIKLTTLVDGVGVSVGSREQVWCIELKTCRLPVSKYLKYATTPCARTPLLRCTPAMPNNEKTKHSIQCGFGAMAMAKALKKPVRGIVVVVCADGVMTYEVPASFQHGCLFFRLARVHRKVTRAATMRKTKKITVLHIWPSKPGDSALVPFKVKRGRKMGKYIHELHSVSTGQLLGVVSYSNIWRELDAVSRESGAVALRIATKRLAKTSQVSLMPYILAVLTTGGRLQLTLAGAPIAGGGV